MPMFLCLQEVFAHGWASKERMAGLSRGPVLDLPQTRKICSTKIRAGSAHPRCLLLSLQRRAACSTATGLIPSEFGLATFVRRSHPAIAPGNGLRARRFFIRWLGGDHPRSRNAPWHPHLRLRKLGYPITIVQLHGLRDPSRARATPRRASLRPKELVEFIQRLGAEKTRSLSSAAIFNVLPDSVTFRGTRQTRN